MDSFFSIGRAIAAALVLVVLVVACEDDGSPTKLAEQPREVSTNPWTTIFAAAGTLGSNATIAFAGSDRSYRLGDLDRGSALPQDAPEATHSVCAIEDATNRGDLDAFRQCMARALREDACRNGGVFVLHRPDARAPNRWRALCPAPAREDDDPEDDQSRVSDAPRASAARATYG